MNTGQTVRLCAAGQEEPAIAVVGGISEDHLLVRLMVHEPPDWVYAMLQKRGIFKTGPHLFMLFKDHAGEWTDPQTLGHFTISQNSP